MAARSFPPLAALRSRRATRITGYDTAQAASRYGPIHRQPAAPLSGSRENRPLPPAACGTLRIPQCGFQFLRAPPRSLRRKPGTPAAERLGHSSFCEPCSSQLPQFLPQFARGAEQRVLHRLFGRTERLADRAQLQSLVVLHFKNHTFTRRKSIHRLGQPQANLLADQVALGIERRAVLALNLKKVACAFLVAIHQNFRSLIFRAGLAAAQMIQTNVGHDAIKPGVEAAFEAETVQVAV